MSTRHRAREVALQILYRYDMNYTTAGDTIPSGPRLADDIRRHFDHFQVVPPLREFAAELVAGTLQHTAELDALIEKYATNWKVSRMALIDRNLLRMALYELIHITDTPESVVIDEAVELAKQFGEPDTSGFINGVLDAAKKERKAG